MKKALLLCVLLGLIASTSTFASASDYMIDDQAIETVFDQAIKAKVNNLDVFNEGFDNPMEGQAVLEGKKPIIAWLISWVGPLNFFAIHRVYLGGAPILIVAYPFMSFLTLGILNLGDWIALLVDVLRDDLGKHEGSDALFMW